MTFNTSFLADRVFWLRARKTAKRTFWVSIAADGGLPESRPTSWLGIAFLVVAVIRLLYGNGILN